MINKCLPLNKNLTSIASESDYPYVPVKRTCKSFTPALKISGFTDVQRSSAD